MSIEFQRGLMARLWHQRSYGGIMKNRRFEVLRHFVNLSFCLPTQKHFLRPWYHSLIFCWVIYPMDGADSSTIKHFQKYKKL
jgi:hypothetical protein